MSLENYIENMLPAGSGVNGEYSIEVKKEKITLKNTWDNMNENGYYDGVFKFSITYRVDGSMVLHFHGLTRNEYRKIENEGLRDYLESLYYEFIPAMVGILENKASIYENNADPENMDPLERGFLETMVQDAEYNFRDDTPENIPEQIYNGVCDYPFTAKNIDGKTLENALQVVRDAGKGLPDNVDRYDLGGEIYLAICYGETENSIAMEIAKSSKWLQFTDASKTISMDYCGKYRVFAE